MAAAATPFEQNLENEINASLTLAETAGRRVLIVAVYSEAPDPDAYAQGGFCRAVSENTTRRDAMAFIAGLEREAARLRKLVGAV